MAEAVYDEHVERSLEFVDRALASEPSLFGILLDAVVRRVGDRLSGARICDVGCGEGYVSRRLGELGAAEVVGIDISGELIREAQRRSTLANVTFAVDDAQSLQTLEDSSCDIVVSQMAIMDIADHRATFSAVARVLVPGGCFVFSFLHPCFEAPFHPPDEAHFLVDENDVPNAVVVRHYGSEGHWQSEGAGLRGHVGSYHRMLSSYVNDLIGAGFTITGVDEPLIAGAGLFAEVPRVMVIEATTGV